MNYCDAVWIVEGTVLWVPHPDICHVLTTYFVLQRYVLQRYVLSTLTLKKFPEVYVGLISILQIGQRLEGRSMICPETLKEIGDRIKIWTHLILGSQILMLTSARPWVSSRAVLSESFEDFSKSDVCGPNISKSCALGICLLEAVPVTMMLWWRLESYWII